MPVVTFPYGKKSLSYDFPSKRLAAVLVSKLEETKRERSEEAIVAASLAAPIGCAPLAELARGKDNIVVIASDHTRPVPSKIIMPLLLAEIRRGNPHANITILISTGCHRETAPEELARKFGEDIVKNERIVIHNCDANDMVSLGTLPSGGELVINRLAAEAGLLVSEGFIEPHFFAGFSGGRKSVLPGVAARKTVMYNHNAAFIDNPCARTGVLENNPIQKDMVFAARKAKLAFICNVVINAKKEVLFAASGDMEAAHEAGCEFLSRQCRVGAVSADIVITSNGGYPLDQNIYQAVKGMTAAEACVNEKGVIIMLAASGDGHGGEAFYKTFAEEKNLARMLASFREKAACDTGVDQWQSQIFARVLQKATVVYISDLDDNLIRAMQMIPARSIGQALEIAENILGKTDAEITAIPDGVAVIVQR
ncbi:MAG: nickel-dependent lactate racemase [Spirochaetaceae bacterium]|jgi:nickel-dependent lactate racemase|nr:nickel-dependent lactate racemase [Spirochaetaceae bacterium]